MANRKFNQEIATNVREDYFCKGMLQNDIERKYNMSRWAVAEIIKNRGWKIEAAQQAYYEEQLQILKAILPTHKICYTCKVDKDICEFNKNELNRDRFSGSCRHCLSEYKKEYTIINKDKLKVKKQEYYIENNEREIARSKQWYQDHKEEKKEYDQQRYEEKGEELRQQGRDYYYDNKEICIERVRQYVGKKYKTDPVFKLKNRVSSEVRKALKKLGSSKDGHSILEFLPYTMQELKEYIENIFTLPNNEWMTWKNWGKYNPETWVETDSLTWTWQLDHIIPQSDLPYTSMVDDNFQKCWALTNLRPYKAKDNLLDGVYRKRHKNGRK